MLTWLWINGLCLSANDVLRSPHRGSGVALSTESSNSGIYYKKICFSDPLRARLFASAALGHERNILTTCHFFPFIFRVRDGVTGLHAIPILQYILILAYPPNRSINNNTSENVTLKGGGVYTLQHQALHRREVICFYQEHKACEQHSISVRDAQTSRRSKCHVYKIPMALASPRR